MKSIFFITILIIIGCSGSNKTVQKNNATQGMIQYDESFDPISLNDDDIVIEEEITQVENDLQYTQDSDQKTGSVSKEVSGWRVQIEATSDISAASLVVQEAKDLFGPRGHKAYLVHESALYKIRIGDCEERSCAEDLRDLARNYGYRQAFLVKTKVTIEKK